MRSDEIWRPMLTLMDRSRIERLHSAATEMLADTGLNVHHDGMRGRLLEQGAKLGDGERVFLGADMVERALGSARRAVAIYDRAAEPVMHLGPYQVYFGTGSDLINSRDAGTDERRVSTLDDVARSARLCDALEDIDFVMSFALPKDAGVDDVEPRQYYSLVCNTTKPIVMTSYSGLAVLERMHEMACLIAGGDTAFRARPNYVMYGQPSSPFQHERMAVERLIFCADHEIPLIYVPTVMPGVSGPITLAGSLALAAAESLAGLVMSQAQRPGAPFVFGACVSQLDMRTMLFPYGSPEWRLSDLVMAELGRYYGLPVFGTAGATDSKTVDAQAGGEYAFSTLAAALAGTNLVHDLGYLESGLTGSLASIVLAAEGARWTKRFISGFSVSPDTLATDIVRSVGPGGGFLDHEHTVEHLRAIVWEPYCTDRGNFDAWVSAGSKDYSARARDMAFDLSASHVVEPLPLGLDGQLRQLAGLATS